MTPTRFSQMMKYLTRAKKQKPDLPDVFPASKAPIPPKTQNVEEIEAINRFNRDNPRKDMANGGSLKFYPKASGGETTQQIAPGVDIKTRDINYGGTLGYEGDNIYGGVEYNKGKVKLDVTTEDGNTLFKDTLSKDDAVNFIVGLGDRKGDKFQIKTDKDFNNMQVTFRKSFAGGGMLVQPGFGGVRQGYRSDKAIKAAQQAGNVAKTKKRFDRIGKAFIEQDYNALKTLTRPDRIKKGAKDAGGILNASDTALLNNVILGKDVKAQNALAKKLGVNRRYMIDTYKEALEFTKTGKSQKQSALALKKIITQKKLFDEILKNPNATVKSMAKKFNKTEKQITKEASKLLRNVYDQNVIIGKKDLSEKSLKSWLPDDFNITDDFLDNFSNIKGLRQVQSENIGTLIRDAFGRGQNPKKYVAALQGLSEYNKFVRTLPDDLKLDLDHPLSKAFLKGSNVSPEKLLYVTPISRAYNRGFKESLSKAYDKALLADVKDTKKIKQIENLAKTLNVNIGKGSTKKFDFGATNIAKKTQEGLQKELTQNLREQNLARENLKKLKKTDEGKKLLKEIFPRGRKLEIPEVNKKLIATLGGGKCGTRGFLNQGGRIGLQDGTVSVDQCYKNALERIRKGGVDFTKAEAMNFDKLTKSLRAIGASNIIKFGILPEVLLEGALIVDKMASEGDTFAQGLRNSYLAIPFQAMGVAKTYEEGEKDRILAAAPESQKAKVLDVFKLQDTLNKKFELMGASEGFKRSIAATDAISDGPLGYVGDSQDLQERLSDTRADLQDLYRGSDISRAERIFNTKPIDLNIRDQLTMDAYNQAVEKADADKASRILVAPGTGLGVDAQIKKRMKELPITPEYAKEQLQATGDYYGTGYTPFGLNKLFVAMGMEDPRFGFDKTGKYNEEQGITDFMNYMKTQNVADAGGVANLAGGGIAKLAGVDSGPPPESGPNSQGLLSLKNRVRNY